MSNSVVEMVEKVEQAAATANHETRDCRSMKVGQVVRQGDLYFVRVNGQRLNKKSPAEKQELNLAAGGPPTSSNHAHQAVGPVQVFESLKGDIEQLDGTKVAATALRGPVVKATGEWSVVHDEHATCLFDAGCYQVIFQLDAVRQERVAD